MCRIEFRNHKRIFAFHTMSPYSKWCSKNKVPYNLHIQYQGCWWHGDARGQGIGKSDELFPNVYVPVSASQWCTRFYWVSAQADGWTQGRQMSSRTGRPEETQTRRDTGQETNSQWHKLGWYWITLEFYGYLIRWIISLSYSSQCFFV